MGSATLRGASVMKPVLPQASSCKQVELLRRLMDRGTEPCYSRACCAPMARLCHRQAPGRCRVFLPFLLLSNRIPLSPCSGTGPPRKTRCSEKLVELLDTYTGFFLSSVIQRIPVSPEFHLKWFGNSELSLRNKEADTWVLFLKELTRSGTWPG